ncbi:methionyl-tRNA formyltransferase [Thermosulfuriphilus ammonigenes]|uniref:Methionyl-tRNA formyltransferase n=1 Tax=Thermosulfuriphilus ammonigenes TaxID=1936021 RepID=A0A6G7PWT6_9BACT|nr:methionyl-tRNA formyltransferase [Thermosulfuriphilus ammonigenes]MBA2847782.1 methionyl-tRNA formyltransferase [Thermosulfuriphilus ammonigenes]QIJ72016.1 methionyl-tRNA formyltransferase [Thermosulfuriphilus ammonigenes]
MKSWSLIFMGTPEFAVPILKALIAGPDEVVAVVCQPDRPRGRGRKPSPPPVKIVAQEAGITVYQPEKIRDPAFISQLKAVSPEAIVVAAYGKILPPEILKLPPRGCINVHASLLPKFRGAAPINWAIISGEEKTGVTIMQMDEGMDTGPIILAREIPIEPEETAGSLAKRLSDLGAELILEAIEGLKEGRLHPRPQPKTGVSYAPPLKKEDGLADFSRPAEELDRLIRGFDPWPTVYTFLQGRRLKLFRPRVIEAPSQAPPGTIVAVSEEGITIATGRGLLLIKEVQLEGRKRLPVAEFTRGYHLKPGMRLG